MSPSLPGLLICGFGPFPGAPDNPAAEAVRRLQAHQWSPEGVRTACAVLPTVWASAPETALRAAEGEGSTAILLVGVALSAAAFRVESLARNRASEVHADAEGRLWPSAAIDPDGPEEIAVGAPAEAMVAAIDALGLPVDLSSDAGAYLCNFTLYRLLAEAGGRMVGFLHVPPPGPELGLDQIEQAVRAAAEAMARRLRLGLKGANP
jgi:pyroglutamyl-peptidase